MEIEFEKWIRSFRCCPYVWITQKLWNIEPTAGLWDRMWEVNEWLFSTILIRNNGTFGDIGLGGSQFNKDTAMTGSLEGSFTTVPFRPAPAILNSYLSAPGTSGGPTPWNSRWGNDGIRIRIPDNVTELMTLKEMTTERVIMKVLLPSRALSSIWCLLCVLEDCPWNVRSLIKRLSLKTFMLSA